jgi:hypothetical protein
MGRFAIYDEQASNAVDLFTVDADFDEAAAGAGWDDQTGLMYALNESATAWRSQFSMDSLDAGY